VGGGRQTPKITRHKARKTAKTKALGVVLCRLNVANNVHTPTSEQLLREIRKEQAAEDKKTGKQPGPKDSTWEPSMGGPSPTKSGLGCPRVAAAATSGYRSLKCLRRSLRQLRRRYTQKST